MAGFVRENSLSANGPSLRSPGRYIGTYDMAGFVRENSSSTLYGLAMTLPISRAV